MAELRLGLVGCGRIAERGYLPALRRLNGIHLAAVADPDPQRRERVAAGVPGFPNAAALIDGAEVDAVVLASPVEAHVADARLAAAAGLHALVEKPPAADAAGAAELAGLDPVPYLGFNRRFDADIERLRQACAGRDDLDLELILDTERSAWAPYLVRDEPLLDLGTHLVDLVRWLAAGEVERVRALELSPARVELELEVPGAHARIMCANDRPWRELVVVRSHGSVVARARAGGLRGRLAARLSSSPSPLVSSLAAQLQAFAGAVSGHGGHPSLATAEDGFRVMRVLEAARDSAAAGGAWHDAA